MVAPITVGKRHNVIKLTMKQKDRLKDYWLDCECPPLLNEWVKFLTTASGLVPEGKASYHSSLVALSFLNLLRPYQIILCFTVCSSQHYDPVGSHTKQNICREITNKLLLYAVKTVCQRGTSVQHQTKTCIFTRFAPLCNICGS